MVDLLVVGFVGVVIVLYATDRVLKARVKTRRLRAMSTRLDAATTRADEQHEHRQAAAQASAALTSFMPAIKHPPLTVPGATSHGATRAKAGCERSTGQQDHGLAQADRPLSRTGEHAARSADRPGHVSERPERPAGPGSRKGHPAGPRRPVA